MKKLSEYKDEEALDILADLLEPVINIMGDGRIAGYIKEGQKTKAIKTAIKDYKNDVMDMMAILEGKPREEYHCNMLTLPMILLNILNDPVLVDFFSSQAELISEIPSGSATESTEEEGQPNTSSDT